MKNKDHWWNTNPVLYILAVPSAAPKILKANSLNSSQILLKWQPPMSSQLNGELTGFVIQYNVEGSNVLQTVTEENKDKKVSMVVGWLIESFPT